MPTLRYVGVSNVILENLKIAAEALEHLRANYFPWGAGNQEDANMNTDGAIRLRTWAIRDRSSPFYRYNGWETVAPGDRDGIEKRHVKDCARVREMVFLGKGGNCQEHGDTTFDYVRHLPFTGNYQYIHRLTWSGHHEYTVIGGRLHENKAQMRSYIQVDPWTTSPQVCLFGQSYWFDSYTRRGDHEFTIDKNQADLQAILSVDEQAHHDVAQLRVRQRLLWDGMNAAQEYYQRVEPLTWMCLNCRTHILERQIVANTSRCHNCESNTRSYNERDRLLRLFEQNAQIYVRNPNRFRTDYLHEYRRRGRKIRPPKVMPLLADPRDAFDAETDTPRLFKTRRRAHLFDGQARIKTVQLDVPKTREMTRMWGDEWWDHPYCTKEDEGRYYWYIYYDKEVRNRRAAKEEALTYWTNHIEACKISPTYRS